MRTLGPQASLKGWAGGWVEGRDWPLDNHTHSPVLGVDSVVRLRLKAPETDHLRLSVCCLLLLSPSLLPNSWCFLVCLPTPSLTCNNSSLHLQGRLDWAKQKKVPNELNIECPELWPHPRSLDICAKQSLEILSPLPSSQT